MKLPPALAASPSASRGRLHRQDDGAVPGPRDAFQRDRDRIIHSVAFRRLRHKTQVFIAPDGDHFRVRLTHSIEVAQIGRTIARALGLNEDLTEALCLAHDLGHPPFGHAGEDALDAALADAGGFDHNAHSVRLVTRLETPYPECDGLNLSWEALEGLAKHNGPIADPSWAMAEANSEWDLRLDSWPSLEAQVAAIADDIAYDNHDIDDGLRAGILDFEELLSVPLIRRQWDRVQRRYPGTPSDRLQRVLVRDQIGVLVDDVLRETAQRIRESGVTTIEDVRAVGRSLVGFSAAMDEQEQALKRFLHARLYEAPELLSMRDEAQRVLANLTALYLSDPALLPLAWQDESSELAQSRKIGDFVAGMTDRFAISRHEQLVGPVTLPDRF